MQFTKGNKVATGGKRAGSGRKKLGVRELCAIRTLERVPLLCGWIDSEANRLADRIAAFKELARIGLPDKHEHTGADGGPIKSEAQFNFDGFANNFEALAGRVGVRPTPANGN